MVEGVGHVIDEDEPVPLRVRGLEGGVQLAHEGLQGGLVGGLPGVVETGAEEGYGCPAHVTTSLQRDIGERGGY